MEVQQTPVGQHICDFVSFPLRLVVELVPVDESTAAAKARTDKRSWLVARGYKVIDVPSSEVETDIAGSLEVIVRAMAEWGL